MILPVYSEAGNYQAVRRLALLQAAATLYKIPATGDAFSIEQSWKLAVDNAEGLLEEIERREGNK